VLSDLAFAHRVKPIETDLVITTPDLLCDPDTINLKNQLIGEIGNFFITSSEKLPVAFGLCHDKVVGLDCFIESQLNKNEESKEGWEALAAYAGDYQTHVVSGDHFQFLNHAVTLDDYLKNWIHCLDHKLEGNNVFKLEPLNVKAHARVGLMGNPSDGFYGKHGNIK
jgi:glucuronokinase